MDKTVIIGPVVFLALGLTVFVAMRCNHHGEQPSAQAQFQARLEAAREGRSSEQIVAGTIRATGGTTRTPRNASGVVAWVHWRQERMSAGSRLYIGKDVRFGSVPFTVDTAEGSLLVDGQLRGLSDLVDRNRLPAKAVEVTVADGDSVTLLGAITKRDGVRGMFGEVIVVKGTYEQWHRALNRTFFATLPRPRRQKSP